jgi:hypothetical protein
MKEIGKTTEWAYAKFNAYSKQTVQAGQSIRFIAGLKRQVQTLLGERVCNWQNKRKGRIPILSNMEGSTGADERAVAV